MHYLQRSGLQLNFAKSFDLLEFHQPRTALTKTRFKLTHAALAVVILGIHVEFSAPVFLQADCSRGRRALLLSLPSVLIAGHSGQASGFENRVGPSISQFRQKRSLFQSDEGKVAKIMISGGGSYSGPPSLDGCEPKAVNCLSSQATRFSGAKLKPWVYQNKSSVAEAMAELRSVVDAYPPGQNNVDGGGFQVAIAEPEYLWVEYESQRFGYIDDVEFLFDPTFTKQKGIESAVSGRVFVRSASRVGEADFGVNAVRLARLASDLKAKGNWEIQPSTAETYSKYWETNCKLPGTVLPDCR